ncbi:hypothetical protein J3A83DRAFT_4535799 [Scleroderma citrinum]
MVSPIIFTGDTHFEVIAVLANCGADTSKARQALVTWIQRKQIKGRSTEHILCKLRQLELKFIRDVSLHNAFRQARALTFLPRSPDIPLPDFLNKGKERQQSDATTIDVRYCEDECPSPISSAEGLSPLTPSSMSRYSSPYYEWRLDSHPEEGESSSSPYFPPSPGKSRNVQRSSCNQYSSTSYSPYSSSILRGYGPKQIVLSPPSPTITPRRFRSVSNPVPPPPSSSCRSIPIPNRLSAPATPLPAVPRPAPTQPIPQSPYSSAASSLVSVLSPVSPDPQPYNDNCLCAPSPLPTPYSSEESVSTIIDMERYVPSDIHLSRDSIIDTKIVTRSDSPLDGMFADKRQGCVFTSTELPPPYDTSMAHLKMEHRWSIGPQLDRALKICGASPVVRQEVLKCISSEPGYERIHWQTRLGNCNLNPDAVDFIMQEMDKELDG